MGFQRASDQILSRDTKEFISELDQAVVSLGQFPRLRHLSNPMRQKHSDDIFDWRECFDAKSAKMYEVYKELTELWLPDLGQPHGAFNLK